MTTRIPLILIGLALIVLPQLSTGESAGAATITVEYAVGHRRILINDYGAPALGTFTLREGDVDMLALCVEADDSHSNAPDAYALVDNRIDSPELDVLLWLLGDGATLDDDVATAAGALAWYYAGANRDIGAPVWSNGAAGFAPVSPVSPEPWSALPPFSRSHPVGLRSNGLDIDTAELRVAELHHAVTTLVGPWTLTAEPATRSVRLTGAAGPIFGRIVTFTIDSPGAAQATVTATTDLDGRALPVLPPLADGAHVIARVDAPGTHREWDGGGGVQRMVTATFATAVAEFDVPAELRHVQVFKRSTDPTIGVAEARFALIDAAGATVSQATTDEQGVARFEPFDPLTHPGPYVVRELVAPPGLAPLAGDVVVPTASPDPSAPTVVNVDDQPLTRPIFVRKQLSEPAGPDDKSGFAFSVHRAEGGFDDELVTGANGNTDVLYVPLGRYTICEIKTPEWAAGFVDGGCVELLVDVGSLSDPLPLELAYLNVVPTTTSTTSTTTPTTTVPTSTVPTTTVQPTTVAPTTTTVAPSTTTTSTLAVTTTTTTTTSTAPPMATTTSTVFALPAPVPTQPVPTSTLPRTGSDAAGRVLRAGDIGFVAGVGLIAVAGLTPRRTGRGTAGR